MSVLGLQPSGDGATSFIKGNMMKLLIRSDAISAGDYRNIRQSTTGNYRNSPCTTRDGELKVIDLAYSTVRNLAIGIEKLGLLDAFINHIK